MFDSLKARIVVILALLALSGWMLFQHGITLGLDLAGGTQLSLEVSDPSNALSQEQRVDAIDRALKIIRTRVDELGVAEPVIQKVGEERIIVELPGATVEEQRRAKDVIQQAAFLKFQIVRPVTEIEAALPRIDRVVAARFGASATAAPAAAPQQPGAVGGLFEQQPADTAAAAATPDTAAAARPFSSKLVPTGATGQFAVAAENVEEVERYLALPEVRALLPRDVELRWGFQADNAQPQAQQFELLYLLEARPLMTGEYLEDAQAQRDPQFNQPLVTFQLSRRGGRIFERATGEHIGDQMAVVLDERVYSAPVIQSQIADRGQITMDGAAIEEARDLALVLRAGALPAPIEIVEERSVGPSLGADSIERGRLAGVIGIALVILIMIGYYRFAGVMAVAALGVYVALVLGGLAGIDAALTLPGIAGIVLSVGMAVDANVLIFERIREELAAGRNARAAVSEGFSNALSAIMDSQLTTLLTAFILFQFGTGPIRGFAITLSIGIIAGLFTAIYVTRTFFMLYLDRRPAVGELSI
jgi:preprotein translocase subunit SecD